CNPNFASDRYFNMASGEKTIPANTWTNVLTVRNPVTYLGKKNHISSQLISLSTANIGNRFVQYRFVRSPVVAGTPIFNSVDTDSVLEFDIAGTSVDIPTSGRTVFGVSAAAGASHLHNVASFGLILHPGETTCLAAFSTQTSDVVVNLREREMF
ncbi:hypothetical protein V6O07_05830, partial [Arthrospira platensis SPKY2]